MNVHIRAQMVKTIVWPIRCGLPQYGLLRCVIGVWIIEACYWGVAY